MDGHPLKKGKGQFWHFDMNMCLTKCHTQSPNFIVSLIRYHCKALLCIEFL